MIGILAKIDDEIAKGGKRIRNLVKPTKIS